MDIQIGILNDLSGLLTTRHLKIIAEFFIFIGLFIFNGRANNKVK